MNNVCATLSLLEDLLEQATEERPREPRVEIVDAKDSEFVLPMSEALLV